jgi:hypothetical protein
VSRSGHISSNHPTTNLHPHPFFTELATKHTPRILFLSAMSFGGFQSQEAEAEPIDASTPYVAAGDGDLELLKASIKQLGLSPNAADSNGFTFLHAACGYGRVEIIKWLLNLNKESDGTIDINARDGDGDTPLHHCDDFASAKLLVEAGCDTAIKNNEGKTALDVKEDDVGELDEDDSDDEESEQLKELVKYLTGLKDGEDTME